MADPDVEERVDYTQYTNRQLMAVPLVVLALALLVIAGWYVTTGAPASPGVEFTGGVELQLEAGSEDAIRDAFDRSITSIRAVGQDGSGGYIVTFQSGSSVGTVNSTELTNTAETNGFNVTAVQETSPSFGQSTQQLAFIGIGAAFVGMTIMIFILFRSPIPCLAVVLSAFSDIVVPVAIMNLIGIKLSLGTVAALLMLIGYSVDSDILLTNQVLRRRGAFYESTYRAMRTGVTMTITSLSAMTVMAIVATFFGIDLLASVGTVLAFGLATDLMNTYLFNVGLLRWYKGVDG
ncbi:MAG: protein translocase subunit SecF [Halobacteriales archaeon]